MSPARSSPGRPRDAGIDDAILAAAREQLATVGYEAMSLVSVAEQAGTTRQALYRRWTGKADLATAAIASMSQLEERPDTDDPFADLVAELHAFRRGVGRRNGISLIGTMLQDSVDPDLVRLFRKRLVAPRRRRLRHILDRARDRGLLAGGNDLDDADLDHAVAAATGVLYAQALAGSAVKADWPRRTAALVWRSCGGEDPADS
ncbi:MAG: TetR/AcrR family transcriptional regulator [Actinomycetota bacterium]